jgi:hypothetical protein
MYTCFKEINPYLTTRGSPATGTLGGASVYCPVVRSMKTDRRVHLMIQI